MKGGLLKCVPIAPLRGGAQRLTTLRSQGGPQEVVISAFGNAMPRCIVIAEAHVAVKDFLEPCITVAEFLEELVRCFERGFHDVARKAAQHSAGSNQTTQGVRIG